MKFAVHGDTGTITALRNAAPDAGWIIAENIEDLLAVEAADAYFNLSENSAAEDYSNIKAPVFINSVVTPLSEMKHGANVIRFNGWTGFMEKELWEIAGEMNADVAMALRSIGKKYITVNDEPGFVSARVIAMIINEAFFAKGEAVSTEADIDIAMKLGTNYPYGPFEWSRLIGLKIIHTLLKKLSLTDERYTPAPEMEKAIL